MISEEPGTVVLCYSDPIDGIDQIAFSEEPRPRPVASFATVIPLIELLLVRSQGRWSFATVIPLIPLIALIKLYLVSESQGGPLLQISH
jgi:hypothetical protein